MLDLAGERSLGTHPYFIDVEHTQFARERLGAGPLVAPEVAVVVEEDDETARKIAREYAELYLGLTNYTSNLLKFGYTERGHRRRRLRPPDRRGDPARQRRSRWRRRSAPTSRRARTTCASSRWATAAIRTRTTETLAAELL